MTRYFSLLRVSVRSNYLSCQAGRSSVHGKKQWMWLLWVGSSSLIGVFSVEASVRMHDLQGRQLLMRLFIKKPWDVVFSCLPHLMHQTAPFWPHFIQARMGPQLEWVSWGHTGRLWQSQDSNLGLPTTVLSYKQVNWWEQSASFPTKVLILFFIISVWISHSKLSDSVLFWVMCLCHLSVCVEKLQYEISFMSEKFVCVCFCLSPSFAGLWLGATECWPFYGFYQ